MKLLHMITGDPQRTPNFVMFGNPDYFFLTSGTPDFVVNPGFSWNHGGVDPKINRTFLAMAGPGVAQLGVQRRRLVRPHRHSSDHAAAHRTH